VLLSYYVAEENEVRKDPVQTCAYSFNLIIPKSPDFIISQAHNLLISKIQINRGISHVNILPKITRNYILS
jgi:hypothetical protein